MDVSCERCGTEYELEDDSVPEGGCPVQCTTCHHTFMVTRPSVEVPTEVSDSSPPPSSADWLLETSDGKLHRFRNLTSLQKWIIERKVTRDDKISRTGHAWRRLGEIVELGPFFDVVDQADRGQAAAAASRELKQEAAEARQGSRPSGARPSSRGPAAGMPPRSTSPVPVARGSSSPSRASADAELDAVDEFSDRPGDTAVVALRSRNRVTIGSIVLIAVGIGTGLIYFSPWMKKGSPPDTVAGPAPVVAPPPIPEPAPPVPVPPVPQVAIAGTPAAALPDAAPAPMPVTPVAPSGGTVAGSGGAAAAPPSGTATPGASAASYKRLVEQADLLLENGSTERAQQMYERALKVNAGGVEAQTGMGYVMLDKGRNAVAVGYFQKSLSLAPSFGPALFGLGEAARAAGNTAQALESYRRYVAVNPGGRYVLAAQRQIRLLDDAGGGTPPPPAPAAAPVDPPVPPAPAAPAADPPAAAPAGPPPSPSQVLEEPAKNP